jgi:hypothetical protein
MSDLSPNGLSELKGRDPLTYRIIKQILDSHNALAQQLNGNPTGSEVPAPQAHAANSVKGGAGILDIQVTDKTPQFRGVEHFADIVPVGGSWEKAQTIHMGATTNHRAFIGKGQYQVRTYAQYPNSPPSAFTYHPNVVDTTGDGEPPMQSGNGQSGYGRTPYLNSVGVPKRQ